jgi:hypothetical protein
LTILEFFMNMFKKVITENNSTKFIHLMNIFGLTINYLMICTIQSVIFVAYYGIIQSTVLK